MENLEPFPHMSDNTAQLFIETINGDDFDVVVEYGSGSSTIYYLNRLIEIGFRGTFISVEFDGAWYDQVLDRARKTYAQKKLRNERFAKIPWSDEKLENYLLGVNERNWDLLECGRRFEAQGKAAIYGNAMAPTHVAGCPNFLFAQERPFDCTYGATIDEGLSFLYVLRHEYFKDQFGESPIKNDYIKGGLRWPILQRLKDDPSDLKAAFIIDGGPRGHIVERIFDMENEYSNFHPTIFLLEANRIYYNSAMGRRATGRFVKGSNRVPLTHEVLYEDEKDLDESSQIDSLMTFGKYGMTGAEKQEKELWIYSRQVPRSSIKPENRARFERASFLFESGQYNHAASEFKELVKSEPQNSIVGLFLADALERSGRQAEIGNLLEKLNPVCGSLRRFRAIERRLHERSR